MPGVYISYPFCNQKCTFCNFASGVAETGSPSRYEAALCAEMAAHEWAWEPETMYFGGGTPSLMSVETLERLIGFVSQNRLTEATLECAPGTLGPDKIASWRRLGINRVSLGVQSFHPQELRQVGRRHTAEIVAQDIADLRAGGIKNFNLDLIAGLPHQTEETWRLSLDWIEQLAPPHVSVYLFEVDEDSRLGNEILIGGGRYGAGAVPTEGQAALFYEQAVERLAKLSYKRYEISNFALPGAESLHNLKYWKLEPYIGFGLDAHSYDGQARWGNPDDLLQYLQRVEGLQSPGREPVDHGEEHFFVGLRLAEGIQPTADERVRFAKPIAHWQDRGLLLQENGRLKLAPQAMLVSNEIFQDFLNV